MMFEVSNGVVGVCSMVFEVSNGVTALLTNERFTF
jgi:hypothetical protein